MIHKRQMFLIVKPGAGIPLAGFNPGALE